MRTDGGLLKLFLSRHGESQFNAENKIGGNSNLTAGGRQYAIRLAAHLDSLIPKENVDHPINVWTSTLERTKETASKLPGAYPQERIPELNEIDAGVCDGLTYDEMRGQYPEVFEGRKQDKLRFRYPTGESYQDLMERVKPVVSRIQQQTGYLIIICHQAVARVMYSLLMGIPEDVMPTVSMPLHTLIELTPCGDGMFSENRMTISVPVMRKQVTFEETTLPAEKTADKKTPSRILADLAVVGDQEENGHREAAAEKS